MTAKLIENMPIGEYHAYSDIKKLGEDAVLSKSMLAVFDDCPAKFEDAYINGGNQVSNDVMNLGNAVHLYALEPELFNTHYYVMPLKKKGAQIIRNARNADFKEQMEIAGERIILQPSDMVDIKGMGEALKKDKKSMLLLDKPGKIEASIFWTDEQTGLKMRCRPDFMPDDGILVDLKTTGRADDDGFTRLAFDKHYDLSVALTARGYKSLTGEWPKEYVFLLAETKRPYVIEGKLSFVQTQYKGGKLSKSYWQIGEDRLSVLLDYYLNCKKRGKYPSYNETFMPMMAPDYQIRKLYEGETQ
jgi:hypothetical protein